METHKELSGFVRACKKPRRMGVHFALEPFRGAILRFSSKSTPEAIYIEICERTRVVQYKFIYILNATFK